MVSSNNCNIFSVSFSVSAMVKQNRKSLVVRSNTRKSAPSPGRYRRPLYPQATRDHALILLSRKWSHRATIDQIWREYGQKPHTSTLSSWVRIYGIPPYISPEISDDDEIPDLIDDAAVDPLEIQPADAAPAAPAAPAVPAVPPVPDVVLPGPHYDVEDYLEADDFARDEDEDEDEDDHLCDADYNDASYSSEDAIHVIPVNKPGPVIISDDSDLSRPDSPTKGAPENIFDSPSLRSHDPSLASYELNSWPSPRPHFKLDSSPEPSPPPQR